MSNDIRICCHFCSVIAKIPESVVIFVQFFRIPGGALFVSRKTQTKLLHVTWKRFNSLYLFHYFSMFLAMTYLFLSFEILHSIFVGKLTKQFELLLSTMITVQVCCPKKRKFNAKCYLKLDLEPTSKD